MKVAILGSGPAGLFAAHAAVMAGSEVRIFSAGLRSSISGAQFMRRPVPGLSGESFDIHYRLDGDWSIYSEKVEGDTADLRDSIETFTDIPAYDLREAYDNAWDLYGRMVRYGDIEGDLPRGIHNWADVVVSSVPARALCHNPAHDFASRRIWIADFVKKLGAFENDVDNLVVCSGYEDDWWYRQSRIGGYESTEFPDSHHPTKSTRAVLMPVSTNCICNSDIVRVGSKGEWKSGVFADSAFYKTEELLLQGNKLEEEI